MIVEVLIEDDDGRRKIEIEGIQTACPQLVLTPWLPIENYPHAYSVTHLYTGRAVSKGPMSMVTALKFVDEIKSKIDWSKTFETYAERQQFAVPQLEEMR